MQNYDIRSLPILGNMMTDQIPDEETQQEKATYDLLYEEYSKDLVHKEDLLKNFEGISTELIKMGFSPKIVLRSFLVHKYSSLEEGVEVLSKRDDLWAHKFIVGHNEKCFICDDFENGHCSIKNILLKKTSINIDEQKMKIALNRLPSSNFSLEKKQSSLMIQPDSCPICFLEINNDMTFSLNCKHKFCQDCIDSYLEEEIKNARVKSIKCPQDKCEETFPEELIRKLVNESVYEKYLKFLERENIKSENNTIPCPIVDCEGYAKIQEIEYSEAVPPVEIDDPNQKLLENEQNVVLNISTDKEKVKYICNKGHPFCGKCKNVWHEDDCNEDREIKEFATTTGHAVKKCYKCRVWTEKNEGCNHMTCQICKFEWCWLCENPCEPDHFSVPGPCFGRQFNHSPDPVMLEFQQMEQSNNCLFSCFFVFYYSCYFISAIIDRNFNNENPRRFSRCTLFTTILILSTILWFFAVLFNGIILMYMFRNIIKINEVNNACSRILCVFTYMVLYFPLYFSGIIISTLWFAIANLFTLIKLIFA